MHPHRYPQCNMPGSKAQELQKRRTEAVVGQR